MPASAAASQSPQYTIITIADRLVHTRSQSKRRVVAAIAVVGVDTLTAAIEPRIIAATLLLQAR
jgi:hypothetical protein